MAPNAKASSSSCLSFLKDALLLPTQNPKLFLPVFVLVAIPTFIVNVTNVFAIQPFKANILDLVNKIKTMDPSTAEYAKLMEEIMKEAKELIIIAIAFVVASAVLSFAKQIVAFFAASTTYSGDRYSLPELVSKVIMKGHRLKGPLVTIAMVSALEFGSVFLQALLLQLVIRRSGLVAMAVVSVFLTVAFVYLNVVFMVAVAASVADAEKRGASALREAWRLMTRARRMEGCVLVLAIEALSMATSPLYVVALGYAKKSVAAGLAVLSAYALLSGAVQLFCFAAAIVYYCHAVDSKETIIASDDYVKIPTGEPKA
ncbi:hypothetical protein EJB05_44423, partial [Eragrostis curvula]